MHQYVPNHALQYLNVAWRKFSAKFLKSNMIIHYMRIIDYHHSHTPHIHGILVINTTMLRDSYHCRKFRNSIYSTAVLSGFGVNMRFSRIRKTVGHFINYLTTKVRDNYYLRETPKDRHIEYSIQFPKLPLKNVKSSKF